jgi:hypothetical protein
MLAWNAVEAGKILETYKLYENKPPDMIMEKTGTKVRRDAFIQSVFIFLRGLKRTASGTFFYT